MEHLTYHQVLADHYEETGKIALVVPQEYEDDVEPHEKKEHTELENQEEFQRFIPRHHPETLTKPHSESDKHTTSVQYNRQTQIRLINIDSKFRNGFGQSTFNITTLDGQKNIDFFARYTSSTNFTFKLKEPIKNVISVRLSSIEIPNSFYTFSKSRGNISFEMTYPFQDLNGNTNNPQKLNIIPGNWDSTNSVSTISDNSPFSIVINSNSPRSIFYELERCINNFYSNINNFPEWINRQEYLTGPSNSKNNFKVSLSSADGKIVIEHPNFPFEINWKPTGENARSAEYGLGYNLGFRNSNLDNPFLYRSSSKQDIQFYYNSSLPDLAPLPKTNKIVADSIVDTVDTNYLFLTLDPDWKVIEQETPDRTQVFSFAKIVIDQPKFGIVYDNGQNTLTKEYFLKQPTNIHSIPVRISDPYDQDIDLNGLDFSFTLELTEVLNSGLYESMRS